MRNVLLVGAGYMAQEYLKILNSLSSVKVFVVASSESKLVALRERYPSIPFVSGGLDKFITNSGGRLNFEYVINAISVDYLAASTISLLNAGVKRILLEKPGAIELEDFNELCALSKERKASVLLAYNRRFYSSVQKAADIIKEDGGATGAHFEFTEWTHTISPLDYSKETMNKWILANSSHVIDTAFHLIGKPQSMNSIVTSAQGNSVNWHPSGAVFIGSGLSERNVPFSYNSNWLSAGRWGIEVFTLKRRLFLKPMERLNEQLIGSITINPVEVESKNDSDYKPGLFKQVNAFLNHDDRLFTSVCEFKNHFAYYTQIAGYTG